MKLHYKKEHISCTNYKSESYEGFGIGTLTSGSNFNSQTLSVKTNFLIFILEGEVEIIPKEGKIKRVIAQEFFFISALSTYEIQVRVPGRYIYMSFLYNDIKLCEKHMLESYQRNRTRRQRYRIRILYQGIRCSSRKYRCTDRKSVV